MSRVPGKLVGSFLFCGVLSLAPAIGQGALMIEVGDIMLQPNQAGQVVTLQISGGEQILGVSFYAQVGDGGPELADFGRDAGTPGPRMTSVDLTSGIFLGNNSGQTDLLAPIGSIPQLAAYGTSTNAGTIAAQGDLVTITFDTTGFDAGSWDFALKGTLAGTTELYDASSASIELNAPLGSVTIVPEPTSLLLLFSGLVVGGAICLGRRRGAAPSDN